MTDEENVGSNIDVEECCCEPCYKTQFPAAFMRRELYRRELYEHMVMERYRRTIQRIDNERHEAVLLLVSELGVGGTDVERACTYIAEAYTDFQTTTDEMLDLLVSLYRKMSSE
jgi:hypothetical protein